MKNDATGAACRTLLVVMFFAAWNIMAILPPGHQRLPNFDKREAAPAAVSPPQAKAASTLKQRLDRVQVTFDPVRGTPKLVSAPGDFLSGPAGSGKAVSPETAAAFAGQAHASTKAFLSEHKELFGFGPRALDEAQIKRSFETAHNGLMTVAWEQTVDSIPIFEAMFISHTTARGELVNISSLFVPDPKAAAAKGMPDRAKALAAPAFSGSAAVLRAARHLGAAEGDLPTSKQQAAGPERRQKFDAPYLRGEADVRLVWLPMSPDLLRLCWDVQIGIRQRPDMYRVLVDVQSGEILIRRGMTEYLSNVTFRVHTSDSPSPFSPGHPLPLTNQPPIVPRALVTWPALDTNASPQGWIDDVRNEPLGNNVHAHTDLNDDDSPDLPRPAGSPFRVFDFPLNLTTQNPSSYTAASVAQLFYVCNWAHDRLYQLGFTEAAGNFQTTNFGRGGLGNDALQAEAQDGGGTDNANMYTPSDGSAPRMQMYVFSGPAPMRDGSFDAEIVIHEYVHGLSNRRVGGGIGLSALQSRGLGEGWSDWYGLALLSESSDALSGVYAAGAYATYQLSSIFRDNYYFGIRRYPYSTDTTKNPLTFKDIDPAQASPHAGIPRSPVIGGDGAEVHNQGEVWCAALWDLRANLILKHGFTLGNELALRLVTDGMNLSPPNPNFLQARDAIIESDLISNGGSNRTQLWAAFAKRGMGINAWAPPSTTTASVIESFELPDDLLVRPDLGLKANGPVGGPFAPSNLVFTLTNSGTSSVAWQVVNTSSWVTLSSTGGVLSGLNRSTSVTARLAAAVAAFPQGLYSATVWFSNLTSGVGFSRQFSLRAVTGSLFDDFDPAIDPLHWDAFSGTVHATNHGGAVSGSNSLWFGGADLSRFAVTRHIDTSSGGAVSFWLCIAGQGGLEPWEDADLPAEAVVLEYTTNGMSWFELGRYDSGAYLQWTPVETFIPAAAQSRFTQFRWRQLENSGSCCDHWALDNVEVATGPRAPRILQQPADRVAVLGTAIDLEIVAGGTSPLWYQWSRNGTLITGATNETLRLLNISSNHAGVYRVTVSNQLGVATSSNALLTVLPADAVVALFSDPAFVDAGGGISAEADNLRASLQEIGFPVVPVTNLALTANTYRRIVIPDQELRWIASALGPAGAAALSNFVQSGGVLVLHGGAPGAVSALLSSILGIHNVERHDNSQSAHDRAPSAAGTQFSDDPLTVSPNDGITVLDALALSPDALPLYTNGAGCAAVLFPHGSGNVVFLGWDWNNATPRGSQDGGWMELLRSGLLQETVPPRPPGILAHPTSRRAFEAGVASFAVAVSGTTPLLYQWSKDGTLIPGATNRILSISNVRSNDAGLYSLTVTNLYGGAASSNALLSVVSANGLFHDDFDPGTDLLQWSSIASSVAATNHGGSVSGLNALWFGGDLNRQAVSRPINTTAGGILEFHLRISDGQSTNWEQADLPSEGIVLEYSTNNSSWAELGRYESTAYHSWAYVVVPLPGAAQSAGTWFRWRQLTHSGSCCDHWAIDDVALFTGPQPPTVLVQPASRVAIVGGTTSFDVIASGSAPLVTIWLKDGAVIPGATNATLVLMNIQTNHAGSYSVMVSNAHGTAASLPAALTVVPASSAVGVFDHPAYVDTAGGTSSESDNVQAALLTNHVIGLTFTNLLDGTAGFRRLVFPEQELRELAADLTPIMRSATSNLVASGGMIVICGTSSGASASLIRDLFGFFLVETNINGPARKTAATAGGVFADGPASLPANNLTMGLFIPSLPAAAIPLYTNGPVAPVVLFRIGAGLVIYLGWDWYDAAPRGAQDDGWNQLLVNALSAGGQLDHFEWTVVSPQVLAYPFPVIIRALDASGRLATNFQGTVRISAAEVSPTQANDSQAFPPGNNAASPSAAISITPAVSGQFVMGAWTGAVSVASVASNLVLRADDSVGNSGLSSPISIIAQPRLAAERYQDILVLTWPAPSPVFQLEASESLTDPNWSPVSAPLRVGDQYLVPIYMDQPALFYRLSRP